MSAQRWMGTGLSLLSLVIGFLVGASSAPVAGVAITAALGIAAAGFVFLQKIAAERQLDAIEKLSSAAANVETVNARVDQLRAEWQQRAADGIEIVGKAIALFAATFALGILLGAWARIANISEKLAVPTPTHALPWKLSEERPVKTENALTWILIQERLRLAGYSSQQVQSLYDDWRKENRTSEPLFSFPPMTGLDKNFPSGMQLKPPFVTSSESPFYVEGFPIGKKPPIIADNPNAKRRQEKGA